MRTDGKDGESNRKHWHCRVGASSSWQMSNRFSTMMEGKLDFGFAIDWMRKDLGLCLDEAKRTGASLPVTALVGRFYAELQATGGGRWYTSALLVRIEASNKKKRSESVCCV